MAGALYPALHWAEITLRNRLHSVISEAYPIGSARSYVRVASWLDARPAILLPPEQEKVTHAIDSLERRNAPRARGRKAQGKPLTEGRLVAELRFGFWTRLLDGVYADWRSEGAQLWPDLLERTFPHCPTLERTRKHIHVRFTEIKELRNRTFHHERIAHQADVGFYDRVLEAVGWIDPVLANGLRDTERPRFCTLLANGPQPFIHWATASASRY